MNMAIWQSYYIKIVSIDKIDINTYIVNIYNSKYEEDYVISFEIVNNYIQDYIHIENIDRLTDDGIDRAYDYFYKFKEKIIDTITL